MARNRMIVDIPRVIQMAIRLRAIKSRLTTGEVVAEAIIATFPEEMAEARKALAEQEAEMQEQLANGQP